MIRNTPWAFVGAALFTAATLMGCGGQSASKSNSKTIVLAVIPKGTTHEFWRSVHFGAQKAATEAGDVTIEWQGPINEGDGDGQIQVVQNFISKGVQGIVLAPLDSQSLCAPVDQAKKDQIPTVIFDSGLDKPELIVSYVATDNTKAGALAAETLGKLMEGKGNVVLMRYNPGSQSTEQREEGFLQAIKEKFPEIKILSSTEYAGTTPEMALDKSTNLLQKLGDQVHGVFTVCEPNTTGMLQALEANGLAGKVKFIGFDPAPRFIDAMKQGKLHGIVLQDPVRMGYLAVKTMVAHLRGEKVEPILDTGVTVATAENMDTPEIQALLHPPVQD